MELGNVGMTQVWSEEVRNSKWTSRWTLSTGGPQGVLQLQRVLHGVEFFRWTQEQVIWVRNSQGWFKLKFIRST